MAERCEMVIGYLVPHRCENPALAHCTQCGRGFCEQHIKLTPQGMVCLACQQGLEQPVVLPVTAQRFTSEDMQAFDSTRFDESDDDWFSDLS